MTLYDLILNKKFYENLILFKKNRSRRSYTTSTGSFLSVLILKLSLSYISLRRSLPVSIKNKNNPIPAKKKTISEPIAI